MQGRSGQARLQLDVSASTHASHRLRCKDVLPGCAGLPMPTTQLYPGCLPAVQGHNTVQGRRSHRDSWFWHSLEPSLNHPNLCTEAVQFYLAELPPDRASNRQGLRQNWEGCSALALVYTPHLQKHHCYQAHFQGTAMWGRTEGRPFAELW